MSIPIIAWLTTLIFSILGVITKLPFKIVIFTFLLLYIGLRYNVGDYNNYELIYYDINLDWSNDLTWFADALYDKIEFGYALLVELSHNIFDSFYLFLFIYTLITLILKFYIFEKVSNNFYISIFLYISLGYYWFDMSSMRMGLATTLVMLSYIYIQKRNIVKFYLTIFLAASIHAVTFIALSLYFITYIKNKYFYISILIVSLLISIYGGLGKVMATIISITFPEAAISEALIRYSQDGVFPGMALFGGTYLLLLFTAIIILLFKSKLEKINIYNRYLILILIFGISLTIAFLDFGMVSYRIKDTLVIPTLCLLLPSFFYITKYKVLVTFIFLAYCVLFFISFGHIDMNYSNLLYS
jgi:hypothetical protein